MKFVPAAKPVDLIDLQYVWLFDNMGRITSQKTHKKKDCHMDSPNIKLTYALNYVLIIERHCFPLKKVYTRKHSNL